MATRRSQKGGYVYFGRSERKNGSVQEYVGSTTRTVAIREKNTNEKSGNLIQKLG